MGRGITARPPSFVARETMHAHNLAEWLVWAWVQIAVATLSG